MCRTLIFFVLGILSLVAAEEKPCTVHAEGKYYDLNNLKGRQDFELQTPGGHKLAINVCQSVTTELYGLKDDTPPDEVAAFVRKDHGDFSIGKVNTALSVVDSKPRLVLSSGSHCKATPDGSTLDLKASTIIEFVCDTSIFGAGQPRLLGQLPPGDDEIGCSYFIEWKTHFACPTNEDSGVWGLLATIAVLTLILLMTYTVLGTLYNRYVLQLRGFDQIPQFSIESMKYHAREAMDWIKDIMATYNVRPRGGLPYTSRGSSATNPVSHHTQASEDLNINTNNNFVRPQPTFTRPASQANNTNPISHHTQTQVETPQNIPSASPPPPPPKQSLPQFAPRRVDLGSRGPTKEEREFLLGDEDDEDDEEGEELQVRPTPATSTEATPNREESTPGPSATPNRGVPNGTNFRGRDNT
ncbi:mannose 6-phosphate receptor domain-containing protein [Macrolepiota fuliginosa MF-IS2]|uniref:Autophagy-related protein 27 n=1 Tax=Macrolepiota fuliginosa MF-IS2 TaxID=1400762 RepID=A0A9P5XAN8_9AGAR|nr:mannose 6-phosphate receptor domain-containing protein [Macrolepiota fuliginosa MF-IS2]